MRGYARCTSIITKLGKNILKDISKYWKLCLNANLACAYQGLKIINLGHGKCRSVTSVARRLNSNCKN